MTEVVTYLFHLADCHVLVLKNAFRLLKSIISCINCRRIHGVQVSQKIAKQFLRTSHYSIPTEVQECICKNMLLGSYH